MGDELVILIPAYNEGPRIGEVLKVVCSFIWSKEPRIIVIDDGSLDDTYSQASRYPVELLRHEKNRGKGAALQSGITYAKKADYWVFLDADLINLRVEHLQALLDPLKENRDLGMTVGQFVGGRLKVDMVQYLLSILNGQRALSGDFVQELPDLSWSLFGVEVFLSRLAYLFGFSVAKPRLEGISHHTKVEKYGFFEGNYHRVKMYLECLRAHLYWKYNLEGRKTQEVS